MGLLHMPSPSPPPDLCGQRGPQNQVLLAPAGRLLLPRIDSAAEVSAHIDGPPFVLSLLPSSSSQEQFGV